MEPGEPATTPASTHAEAETKISQAIALDGRNPNLKITAANVREELEDLDRAEGFYKEIIAESRLITPIVVEARARLDELRRRQQSR